MISQSFKQSVIIENQSATQAASWLVSQLISQSNSQSVSQSVIQTVSYYTGQAVSHLACQSVPSHWANQSVIQSIC